MEAPPFPDVIVINLNLPFCNALAAPNSLYFFLFGEVIFLLRIISHDFHWARMRFSDLVLSKKVSICAIPWAGSVSGCNQMSMVISPL